jgi:hypothetical protein
MTPPWDRLNDDDWITIACYVLLGVAVGALAGVILIASCQQITIVDCRVAFGACR